MLRSFEEKDKLVAGICGGAVLLAQSGMLDGKTATGNTSGIFEGDPDHKYYDNTTVRNDFVVVDGNVITGQGQAYAEFAIEVGKKLGMFKTEQEYKEELNWVKNIR